jgi:hypothetical protein
MIDTSIKDQYICQAEKYSNQYYYYLYQYVKSKAKTEVDISSFLVEALFRSEYANQSKNGISFLEK